MNKTIKTILILLLASNWIVAQDDNCARQAAFGEKEICLPLIKGYQECYPDSIVKQLADGTEIPANMVLGFYLNDQTYTNRDSIGLIGFDDYFKIYGTKQIKDYKADAEFLGEMKALFDGTFISKNWELMEKEVDKIGLDVQIGVPTTIKNYKLSDNSLTYVMLASYELAGEAPFTMAMTINGMVVNERLVWMAYYLNYKGEETIATLQKNSDMILTKLLAGG